MGVKHSMTESPQQRRFARRRMSGLATACDIVFASILWAAALTVLMANVKPEKPTVVATAVADRGG